MAQSFLLILISLLAQPSDDGLDSILAAQRKRAGIFASERFAPLENGSLTGEELTDYRFLLSYLPLSDLAAMSGSDLLENIRLARTARLRFSWGQQLGEDLYRNFVLPHRASQEPFVPNWREQFLEELTPRVQGLSMTDAALEVNHWCREKATFRQTDARDQDPLTTVRSGFGRCEEEMILAIAALRSVGIPSRQCYTPYWAHCDNNHAWVEVWADGAWHYFGACEPAPSLGSAWFTDAAQRAMLVISSAYGDYKGTEPILRRYGRSTLINSTAVYGETKELTVTLLDPKGKPVPNHRVLFSLYNYGALMPALALSTDSLGVCRVNCGRGSWIVSTGDGKSACLSHVSGVESEVELKLKKIKKFEWPEAVDYIPPPPSKSEPAPPLDSLFQCRMSAEDSMREGSFWSRWKVETGVAASYIRGAPPDSTMAELISKQTDAKANDILKLLEGARGNWGEIFKFMNGSFPDAIPNAGSAEFPSEFSKPHSILRLMLVNTLTDKDLRDFKVGVLQDHLTNTTLDLSLSDSAASKTIEEMGIDTRERFQQYVIAPRLDHEPSLAWRGELIGFLKFQPEIVSSPGDAVLLGWLRDSIAVEKDPDRLGPPLTPDQALSLRRGSARDVERLYAGLCRVRGIPARFDPALEQLQRWEDGAWVPVDLSEESVKAEKSEKPGQLIVEADSPDSTAMKALYMRDWALSKWESDYCSVLDLGYQKPFSDLTWPQEIPPGLYCLSTGIRREDGSAPVNLRWFRVKAGKKVRMALSFRKP